MPDAIELLTSDHRTVDRLFQQVEGKQEYDHAAVDQIVKELSVHDAIEKQHLYPIVRTSLADGGDVAHHSQGEHDEVARTLFAIDVAQAGSAEERDGLATLIELVRTHVEEEEQQIFPKLQGALDAQALDRLGSDLEAAKKLAPTRPHPHAPSEGIGTTVAGIMSAPLDRVKDKVQGR